jgi:DNA-binding PadR family transcriptional regulator
MSETIGSIGTAPLEGQTDLPTSSYAVLGLLTFGEMSGYDLGKMAGRSVGFFFSPAKSQIYAELRRLESVGYVSVREIEQETRPDKRLYRISREGRRALRRWLEDAPVESPEIKSPFLLKVFFGQHMDIPALLAQFREARDRDRAQLATYRVIERGIKDDESMFFPYLTLRSGIAHVQASLRWEDEAIRELQAREKV